jgi:hypothetical protein
LATCGYPPTGQTSYFYTLYMAPNLRVEVSASLTRSRTI